MAWRLSDLAQFLLSVLVRSILTDPREDLNIRKAREPPPEGAYDTQFRVVIAPFSEVGVRANVPVRSGPKARGESWH
jgi:hypothetical protein